MARKNPKKIKGRKLHRHDLKKALHRYLKSHPGDSLSARQLIKRLKVGNDKNTVTKSLNELVKEKKVALSDGNYRIKGGKARASSGTTYIGIVDMVRSGDAYIMCDDLEQDVLVRAQDLQGALDGDTVEIEVYGRRRGRMSGSVVKVVKRSVEQFIGTFYAFKKYGIVVPDYFKIPFDIVIGQEHQGDAEHGDKVVVRITDWSSTRDKAPEGEIMHVLGAPGSSEIEMQSILLMNGFNVK